MVGAVMTHVNFDATVVRGTFQVEAEFGLTAGETTAIVGPNGAGKSTILAAIAGLTPIDSGRIEIANVVVDDPIQRLFVPSNDRRLGVVFQDHLLFPNLSVLDNVAFGLRARGDSKASARTKAMAWLERDGLQEFVQRRPHELSGGQGQRVALTRALATEPDVLILDEPLSALDVEAKTHVRGQLSSRLQDFSGATLLVTHNPVDVNLLADQLIVLESGRIVQRGTPGKIRREPKSSYIAAFAGLNHLRAEVRDGQITVAGVDVALQAADRTVSGAALVTIAPSAIALHRERPAGSPRNVWLTRIAAIEEFGDVRRVTLVDPLELAADLTPGAVESMSLATDLEIWASVKATEVGVVPLS